MTLSAKIQLMLRDGAPVLIEYLTFSRLNVTDMLTRVYHVSLSFFHRVCDYI